MTIERRVAWDGSPLAVNGGEVEMPDEALHNSAVVGSSNAPVEPEGFDPGDHTVEDVVTYVVEHPDEQAAVLAAELAGKARVTLLAVLDPDVG